VDWLIAMSFEDTDTDSGVLLPATTTRTRIELPPLPSATAVYVTSLFDPSAPESECSFVGGDDDPAGERLTAWLLLRLAG
jgi:hypothetical protein